MLVIQLCFWVCFCFSYQKLGCGQCLLQLYVPKAAVFIFCFLISSLVFGLVQFLPFYHLQSSMFILVIWFVTQDWGKVFFNLRFLMWLSDKESVCQCRTCRKCEFNPWDGKIPWRRTLAPLQFSGLKKIPWMEEESGGLQSIGSQRVRHG